MTRVINRMNANRTTIDRELGVRWITDQPQLDETHERTVAFQPKILTEGEPLPSACRLVVLVPDCELDLADLARRIWNLAAPDHLEVFLLTVPDHPDNKYSARQSVSTLAAAIRSEEMPVQIRVDSSGSYLQAVNAVMRSSDVLVSFAEMAPAGLGKKQKFVELLAASTGLPVYTLNGTLPRRKARLSSQLIEFLLLAACLATIIAFFGIQVWLDHNLIGTWKTILEIISVLVEVRLILLFASFHF